MKPNADRRILFERIMEKSKNNIVRILIQWLIFLATNLFFVCKYVPRIGWSPVGSGIVFGLVATGLFWLYREKIRQHISERLARNLSVLIIVGILAVITLAIILIDPLSIQVDRWSATTYFLDALFQGIYPYGVNTHVSEFHYASPFPLWHYLNIPFWLMGEVGWIQAFFLLVFVGAIYYYFRSWKIVLSTLLLLCISPAYWWEIATRSDGLSNAFLVGSVLLFIHRFPVKMEDKWWLLAILSGCIASTRLSAIIPIALYLFRPWLEVDWKKKLGFIGIALGVVLIFFMPYVLWDTTHWVFFHRNPFMSQTSPGSPWILGVMVIVAIGLAYRKMTFLRYAETTAVFLFAFMLFTQLGVIWRMEEPVTLFSTHCDISYFTLSLPYVIIALVHREIANGANE